MSSITIEQAQVQLTDLIRQLMPGDEVLITENNRSIARLTSIAAEPIRKPRQLGTLKGTVLFMAADFDAPLEDFSDDME